MAAPQLFARVEGPKLEEISDSWQAAPHRRAPSVAPAPPPHCRAPQHCPGNPGPLHGCQDRPECCPELCAAPAL